MALATAVGVGLAMRSARKFTMLAGVRGKIRATAYSCAWACCCRSIAACSAAFTASIVVDVTISTR
ncbi:hypothetical protein, partial [Amycolatopsis mediterranei]|uniref:hypothetical protein n=1 Tax=Amycolatopsis mediterranei TaxID=33910 RepID=UPI00333161CE